MGDGGPVIKLLSYNIRSMRDDTAALTRVLRAARADIVCLQEAPRFWRWRARRLALARSCGMTLAVSKRPAGLAVLVTPAIRVIHAEFHLLTRVPKLRRRGLAVAVCSIDGVPVVIGCTHLDLSMAARCLHAGEISHRLERLGTLFAAPVVLAGDINEAPDGPTWRCFGRRWHDAYAVAPHGDAATFPARAPSQRIDAVFAGSGARAVRCGPLQADPDDLAAASDHLPVLAEILLETT